jgi:hypothetical protein
MYVEYIQGLCQCRLSAADYALFLVFHFSEFRNNIYVFLRARPSLLHPTPNLEDQVPVFMSPNERTAQLYSQAPGSLFFPFYYSQGYGASILTHLHAGKLKYYFS